MFPAKGAGLFHEHSDIKARYFHRSYLKTNKVKVEGQGKFNTHIIFKSKLMLYAKNYQNWSMLVETTARQSWCIFFETQCRMLLINGQYILRQFFKQKKI